MTIDYEFFIVQMCFSVDPIMRVLFTLRVETVLAEVFDLTFIVRPMRCIGISFIRRTHCNEGEETMGAICVLKCVQYARGGIKGG